MSYKIGDRVRIDEAVGGEVQYPYTGVGTLSSFLGEAWEITVEWLNDENGERIGGPGETYTVLESEIVEVLND